MLSRRGLLFTGSAAVALSMVGNRPLLAVAAEEDRYAFVLQRANELVTSAKRFQHLPEFKSLDVYADWCAQGDVFIRDVLRLFPEQTNHKELMQVCNGFTQISALDDAELRELVPGVVPIALTRELIQRHKIPFDMLRQKSVIDLAQRYREHINASP